MSSPEPPPASEPSLWSRLVGVVDNLLTGRPRPKAFDSVKLIHAEDLLRWERFPRWQEFDGLTYADYRAQAVQLERRRKTVSKFIEAETELARVCGEHVVEYASELVKVPGSLTRGRVRTHLPESPRSGTWVRSSEGEVRGDRLEAESGWRSRWVTLTYEGPSTVVHRDRIVELEGLLRTMSDDERRTAEEVTHSRFAHPVLFVSHRWATEAHPDPSGVQLRRLRSLRDCFIIYDYSSFPQPPRTDEDEVEFRKILGAMDELITNVVILDAEDYLARGWCLYEYIVASLHRTTVCDEVHDPRFATLRDWASTPPPTPVQNPWRDSFESMQQNFINERVLASVNTVLPLYQDAEFQTDEDREVVTGLLVEHLKRTLPSMKEHQPYLGEWKHIAWTDATLAAFFRGEGQVPSLQTIGIERFDTAVPSTLQDAVDARYTIRRYDWRSLWSSLDSLARFRVEPE